MTDNAKAFAVFNTLQKETETCLPGSSCHMCWKLWTQTDVVLEFSICYGFTSSAVHSFFHAALYDSGWQMVADEISHHRMNE